MPNVTVTTMITCDRKMESTGNIVGDHQALRASTRLVGESEEKLCD